VTLTAGDGDQSGVMFGGTVLGNLYVTWGMGTNAFTMNSGASAASINFALAPGAVDAMNINNDNMFNNTININLIASTPPATGGYYTLNLTFGGTATSTIQTVNLNGAAASSLSTGTITILFGTDPYVLNKNSMPGGISVSP
jgi:hypothetical protein